MDTKLSVKTPERRLEFNSCIESIQYINPCLLIGPIYFNGFKYFEEIEKNWDTFS